MLLLFLEKFDKTYGFKTVIRKSQEIFKYRFQYFLEIISVMFFLTRILPLENKNRNNCKTESKQQKEVY